jgi:hypothetical protein
LIPYNGYIGGYLTFFAYFFLCSIFIFSFPANSTVTFEREAVLSHIRSLKSTSEQVSAEHERFLQEAYQASRHHAHSRSDVREVEVRERQRRTGQLCEGELNLSRILRRVIRRNCNLQNTINECSTDQLGSQERILSERVLRVNDLLQNKTARLDMGASTPHFNLNSLRTDRDQLTEQKSQLSTALSNLHAVRNQCRTHAAEIFSQQCGSSYNQVFDRIVRTTIATNCAPHIIDQYANDFINFMESNPDSPVQILRDVQLQYVEARRTEMEAARIISQIDHFIAELDNFIFSLENRSNSSPLVETSPRPKRRPAHSEE